MVEGVYQRLCIRYKDTTAADDHSMSLTELRLGLGVTEALLNEALWLLTFPGDKRITYPTPGRVAWAPTGESDAGSRRQPEVSRVTVPA